jgi:hypothetical protein
VGKYGLSRLRADSSLRNGGSGHRPDVSVYRLGRAGLDVCIASRASGAGPFLHQRTAGLGTNSAIWTAGGFGLGLDREDPMGAARRASDLSPCGQCPPTSALSHTSGLGLHGGVRDETRQGCDSCARAALGSGLLSPARGLSPGVTGSAHGGRPESRGRCCPGCLRFDGCGSAGSVRVDGLGELGLRSSVG